MYYMCEASVEVEVRIDEKIELWLVCFCSETEHEGEKKLLFLPQNARETFNLEMEFWVEAESEEGAKSKAKEMLREESWDADFYYEGDPLEAAVTVTNVEINDLKVRKMTREEIEEFVF